MTTQCGNNRHYVFAMHGRMYPMCSTEGEIRGVPAEFVYACNGVQPDIYEALLQQTLSSFEVHRYRYKAAQVRTSGARTGPCPWKQPTEQPPHDCGSPRISWHFSRFNQPFWRSYRTECVRKRRQCSH